MRVEDLPNVVWYQEAGRRGYDEPYFGFARGEKRWWRWHRGEYVERAPLQEGTASALLDLVAIDRYVLVESPVTPAFRFVVTRGVPSE